jgi:malate/lactate dehydrogenase
VPTDTIAGIVGELDRVCPGAVVVLVTNPVDVLTRIAIETSARPAHLILGCGTVLDGARLRQRIGELLDVERESVHAYVIGARIVRAVARDEKRIFMVSVLAAKEYGIGPVVLGLLCVIGAAGVDRQLPLAMSAEEHQMLQHSAAILERAYRSLTAGGTAAGSE